MKLSPKAQAAMNKVVEKFKSGDLSPIVEMTCIRLPDDAPAARWSFPNRVIAYAQTGSLDLRGFRQWKTVGRSVKKGESAAYILGPVLVPKTREKDGVEETYQALVGFRGMPVFAYQQTEGEEHGFSYEPKTMPPLLDVAEKLGISVSWQPVKDAYGYCTPDGSVIAVGVEEWRTFFHELAHACHARIKNGLKGGQHADQETVAEFVACVLAAMYGQDHSGYSWDYIRAFNGDPLKAVFKALSVVEKVLEVIEETHSEP